MAPSSRTATTRMVAQGHNTGRMEVRSQLPRRRRPAAPHVHCLWCLLVVAATIVTVATVAFVLVTMLTHSVGPQQPLQNPSTPHMHHASSSTSMTTSTLTGGSDHGPSSTPLPSNMSTMTRRMSTSSHMRQEKEDVPMGFDEGVLRALCDMDVSARMRLDLRTLLTPSVLSRFLETG